MRKSSNPPVYPYFDLYPGLSGLNECEAVAEFKTGLPPSSRHETANYSVSDLCKLLAD